MHILYSLLSSSFPNFKNKNWRSKNLLATASVTHNESIETDNFFPEVIINEQDGATGVSEQTSSTAANELEVTQAEKQYS